MKVKAQTLVQAVPLLQKLDFMDMKLSTAHKLRKILKEAQEAISDFEQRRIALAQEHGELNEEKTKYEFKTDEMQEQFQNKLQALLDEDLELDIKPIPIELVDDHINVAPAGVELLEWAVSGLD